MSGIIDAYASGGLGDDLLPPDEDYNEDGANEEVKVEKKKKKKKALPKDDDDDEEVAVEGEEVVIEKKKKKKKKVVLSDSEGSDQNSDLDESNFDADGNKIIKPKKKKGIIVAGNDVEQDEDELEEEYLEEDAMRFKISPKHLQCRYYESPYPELETLVMVNVRHIAQMGAYVSLLEYNNIEGMILLTEISRRRIRSINKLIRVNRNEVVMVLRVDTEKGYIDLSKRRVSPEDIIACEEKFNKAKAVHSVLRHLAEQRNLNLEDVYKKIGWPLYKKYGHAYDAFKLTLTSDEDPFAELEIEEDMLKELKVYIHRRLSPQPIKIRADIEVSCFSYEGIDAIREALFLGIKVGNEAGGNINNVRKDENAPEEDSKSKDPRTHNPNLLGGGVKIKLIAPPIYVLSCMSLDKDTGINQLTQAIAAITTSIQASGGKIDIKMAPKAVSVREENELQAMMDRLALENEEVDGDEAEDEEGGGGSKSDSDEE